MLPTRRRVGLLVSALVVPLGVGLTQPVVAVTWPAAVKVSAVGRQVTYSNVAVGPDGTAVAAWSSYQDGVPGTTALQVSERPPGGAWSAPVNLWGPGSEQTIPVVAAGPKGERAVAWAGADGANVRPYVSTRLAGGSWSAPLALQPLDGTASGVSPVFASDGSLTVTWSRDFATVRRIESVTRSAGVWGAVGTLSNLSVNASTPRVLAGPQGSLTAVWEQSDADLGPGTWAASASKPAGGAWSAPVDVSPTGADTDSISAAVGPDGTVVAIWARYPGPSSELGTATRTPAGTWGAPVVLSTPGASVFAPAITAGRDLTFTAAWRETIVDSLTTVSVRIGGSWTPPLPVSVPGGDSVTWVGAASGADGSTLVTWFKGGDLQAATRTPTTLFSPPATLSTGSLDLSSPTVAVGADGTAALLWARWDGTDYAAQAIVADKAFPRPAPDTSTIKGKKKITKAKAKYTFSSPEADATFECRVDKKFKKYAGVSKKKAKKQVPWKACSSPYVVKAKKLKAGKHKLYVRAVVPGSLADPTPSVKKFSVRRP